MQKEAFPTPRKRFRPLSVCLSGCPFVRLSVMNAEISMNVEISETIRRLLGFGMQRLLRFGVTTKARKLGFGM